MTRSQEIENDISKLQKQLKDVKHEENLKQIQNGLDKFLSKFAELRYGEIGLESKLGREKCDEYFKQLINIMEECLLSQWNYFEKEAYIKTPSFLKWYRKQIKKLHDSDTR